MKKIQYLLSRVASSALIIIFGLSAFTPATVLASSSSKTPTTEHAASIDTSSLLADSGTKPTITGTTTDGVAKIRLTVTASSTGKVLFKSSTVTVKRDTWSRRITRKLPDGIYTVSVYEYKSGRQTLLTQGTLTMGIPPVTLRVSSIPLLGGGTAHPGATVPISYLQVVNQSSSTVAVKGFWVHQDGSAPVSSVIGFSSVDDKSGSRGAIGGVEGATPFVNGSAYVPSTAVFAPGERKLFTLKAQLSSTAGRYAGTALMLNVSGVDASANFKAAFPIVGTTWMLSTY